MKTDFIWRILSLLGLAAACTNCEESVDMYGVPYVTFSAKGKVTDNAGRPIPGIQVRMEHSGATLTDGDGRFGLTVGSDPDGTNERLLYFEDIDGEENGLFVDTQAEVPFRKNAAGDYVADDLAVVMSELAAGGEGK